MFRNILVLKQKGQFSAWLRDGDHSVLGLEQMLRERYEMPLKNFQVDTVGSEKDYSTCGIGSPVRMTGKIPLNTSVIEELP